MPRGRHLLVVTMFLCVVCAWNWPVVKGLNEAIPGSGAGDNVTFVWNLWWTRRAVLLGSSPLWCPVLFAPFGVSLVLHTLTLLPALAAAPFANTGALVAVTNGLILTHLWLDLAMAYALAYRITRDTAGSVLAAAVFGWSPFIGAHLLGHFNLVAAWVLPLDALLMLKALEDPGGPWPGLLGLALAGTAYTDYYYAVYAGVLCGLVAVSKVVSLSRTHGTLSRPQRAALATLGAFAVLALAVAVTISLTGGTTLRLGSTLVSMRAPGNLVAAAAVACFTALFVRFLPGLRFATNATVWRRVVRRLVPAVVALGVCTAPLTVAAIRLWRLGDYSSQAYLWRSAPAGIDLGGLLLGNPRGLLWNGVALHAFERLGIDGIEQVAWLAPGGLILCACAWRFRRGDGDGRLWWWLGSIFLVWSLGPFVVAFGHRLPIPLPAILLRYVPIVANARIPARAMVVVYLAVAMLAAQGFTALRTGGRTGLALALAGLAIADLLPASPPMFHLDRPAIYDTLAHRPEQGTVCELPLGLRDGFGVAGIFDSRVLWYQTIHERPITGGFVARLPKRMVPAYEGAPILGSFLRLSSGGSLRDEPVPGRAAAAAALAAQDVRFLVIDRPAAPPDLIAYVRQLPVRELASDGTRELWIVERP